MADQNNKPAKGAPMLPKKPPTAFGLYYQVPNPARTLGLERVHHDSFCA